jgi:hypothetical protein
MNVLQLGTSRTASVRLNPIPHERMQCYYVRRSTNAIENLYVDRIPLVDPPVHQ